MHYLPTSSRKVISLTVMNIGGPGELLGVESD